MQKINMNEYTCIIIRTDCELDLKECESMLSISY